MLDRFEILSFEKCLKCIMFALISIFLDLNFMKESSFSVDLEIDI